MINEGKIKAIEDFSMKFYPVLEKSLKLLKYLPKKGRHLDFGCGLGTFTYLISRARPGLVIDAIDADSDLIRAAEKRYPSSSIHFERSLEINGIYNSITAINVMHELKGDLKKQLREFHKHLAPSAILFIFDFRKVSKGSFVENYNKNSNPEKNSFEEEYAEHNKWSAQKFENLCMDAGFGTLSLMEVGDFNLAYVGRRL